MNHEARASHSDRPRLLLLSMYPLDRGLWGATTRITQMRDALARRGELDVISGGRARRGLRLAGYLVRGGLRGLGGIYVENSTALPGPADIVFLAIARVARVPVVTYLRDAQQLFAEYYDARSLKRRLSRALFRPATSALIATSTVITFPSRGLAAAILGDRRALEAELLPPGAPLADAPAVDPGARRLLFVGALRYPAHGGDLLLAAVEKVRAAGHDVRLTVISREGEEGPGPYPDWVDVRRAQGREIHRVLPGILASITPRRRTPYNDLAVPIKVLEYLGYGRPLIVTDATETAAIVRDADCGVVVEDNESALAEGILRVITAPPEQITAWGAAARRAATENSWDARAERVLELMGVSS